MKRQKIYCQSCEMKMTVTVTESNYESGEHIEILYCPVCSAELMDDEERFDLMDYMNGEDEDDE